MAKKNFYFPWREIRTESRFQKRKEKIYDCDIIDMDFSGNYYMASSASGQYAANSVFLLATRAGKMERYRPPGTARFVPANKISPKFKQVHESFLSPKLFSAKVKRFFCDFSVSEKASTRMKTKKTKMLMSCKKTFCKKNRQIQKLVLNLII